MKAPKQLLIHGSVSRPFEPVRQAFIENFTHRGELGGACCIYQDGEKVVDLWGGLRDRASGEPWREDTMVLVHSTTKGMAAMVMALAHSRRWLDYEERVSTYWPEFAQNGKEGITVRQLLAHQAGLFAFDEKVDREVVADLDRLAGIMARQRPIWGPVTGRPTTRSASAFTRARSSAGSIPDIGASARSSTRRSPSPSASSSTSACRSRFPTRASRRSSHPVSGSG